ncbi:hypothetical protein ACIQPR_43830 [Streptomyces sp. NPDC091280]|uniref:hypothetical protein n=1 Tax=Streptomyces sp. NPDC091280 TaxID=3365984 RepID=UPI00381EB403
MTDKPEDVESVMKSIEDTFALAELEKRALVAVAVAEVAGTVLRAALDRGIPYEMAKEMAQDYWVSEMAPTIEVVHHLEEDEE